MDKNKRRSFFQIVLMKIQCRQPHFSNTYLFDRLRQFPSVFFAAIWFWNVLKRVFTENSLKIFSINVVKMSILTMWLPPIKDTYFVNCQANDYQIALRDGNSNSLVQSRHVSLTDSDDRKDEQVRKKPYVITNCAHK